MFDGIPFDQVNTAEQLRISVAIAAAMNPKLKVMLIRHGNDLDAESFALLGVLAAENGLQVWIERIEGGKGAVIIEDGRALQGGTVEGGEPLVVGESI